MTEIKKEPTITIPLLQMVTRFYEGIYTGSKEDPVQAILSEAARVFQADIATWFIVTENREKLQLVDVFNDLGDLEQRPPFDPYNLNWTASKENEVSGLTAWTAISAEPLDVPSYESLTVQHGKCHAGRWDKWLYPQGVDHPESGFLCMYAVPLLLPLAEGKPKERVVGVLKMERRRMKGGVRREIFSDTEKESFNVIARIMGFAYFHNERQKTLTLADIGHTLIRPLGDVALSLDSLVLEFAEESFNIAHARGQVQSASDVLRSLSRMMAIAKESYHEPFTINKVDIYKDLELQGKALSLSSGREIRITQEGDKGEITLTRRDHAALLNIAINLLLNATQNSTINSIVQVTIVHPQGELKIKVENQGVKISENTLQDAKTAAATKQSFRGLPRSYQLAAQKDWELEYSRDGQTNCFTLIVPIQSERRNP